MERFLNHLRHLALFLSAVTALAASAAEQPWSTSVDGRLFRGGTNTPLKDASLVFVIQIMNPGRDCVLYEETQVYDTELSNGYFSLKVGSRLPDLSGRRTSNDPGYTMSRIFNNTLNSFPASSGCGAGYTPGDGDARYLRVSIQPSGGLMETLSPDIAVASVPSAKVAETIGGLDRSQILNVNNTGINRVNMTNLESVFNTTQLPILTALLGGTSSLYMRQGSNGTAVVPGLSGNAAGASAGQIWYDTVSNQLKYQSNSGPQALGVAGSGVTSVSAGTGLNVGAGPGGSITTSGTLNVNVGTGDGQIVQVQTGGKLPALNASDLTNVNGSAIQSGTIGGTTALNTSGNLTTTGTVNSGAITSTGNIAGANLTATNSVTANDARLNALRVYKPSTSNYVEFVADSALSASVVLTLPTALGTNGQVLQTDNTGKLSWVSISNTPGGSAGGDLGGNYPNPSVNAVRGNPVATGTLAVGDTGKVYRWSGTQFEAVNFGVDDLRTEAGLQQFATNCGADQTLTWSTITDAFACTTIGIAGTQITSGTINAARLPTIDPNKGGTGLTSLGTSNQVLGVNNAGSAMEYKSITGGAGVTITHSAGGIQVSATGSGGTVTNVTGSAPISVTNNNSTPAITISQANTSTDGYLSSADWNTFNSKQAAGNYLTGINGDVVATGPGSVAATIQANAITTGKINNLAVTDAKINDVAWSKITGVPALLSAVNTAGTGNQVFGMNAAGSAGEYKSITGGSGVTITHSANGIEVSATGSGGTVTAVTAGTGINVGAGPGGTINGSGTLNVDVGTTTGKILQVAAGNKLPVIDGSNLTNLNASNISSGTLAIAQGGTGQTTANGALNALLPLQALNSGKVLQTNGTDTSWVTPNAGTVTNVTGTAPISVTSNTTTPSITISQANTTTPGYLSAADWTTFNSKQPAGNYITALSGDVVATGPGSATATIQAGAVNNSKISDVAWSKITGVPALLSAVNTGGTSNQIFGLNAAGSAGEYKSITGGAGVTITHSVNGIEVSATGSGGTVTAVSAGTGLNVGAGPGGTINGSGTLNIDVGTTTGKIVQVGAGNKLPVIDGSNLTNLNASNVSSGTLAIAQGGTGQTTANGALNALLPSQSSNSGKVLQTNGTNTSWVTPNAGTVTNVTATAPLSVTTGTTTPALTIDQASTTTSGYLTSTDWNTFNNKASTTALNSYVLKAGDTMTGALNLPSNGLVVGTNQIVASGGFIGIGTASPGYQLDVAGSAHATDFKVGSNALTIRQDTTNTSQIQFGNHIMTPAGVFAGFGTNANSNAQVLIRGNTSDATKDALSITDSSSAGLFKVRNDGNVGIGVTSPTEKLDVSGKVKATELCIGTDCRATWPAGSVTSVTSANSDIAVATTTTTPVLTLNSGTGANQIVKLNGSSELPAVSGANLTNLNASNLSSGTLPAARLPAFTGGDVTSAAGSTTLTLSTVPVSKGGTGSVSFSANRLVSTGVSGTALTNFNCPVGQLIKFDAGGAVGCDTVANIVGYTPANGANYVAKTGDTMSGALTVAGTIESTSGGIKFPDGTTQTTAAASGAFTQVWFSVVDTTYQVPASTLNLVLPTGKIYTSGSANFAPVAKQAGHTPGTNGFNTTTGEFKPPVAGRYYLQHQASAQIGNAYVSIAKNGTEISRAMMYVASSYWVTGNTSVVVDLLTTDIVTFSYYATNNTSIAYTLDYRINGFLLPSQSVVDAKYTAGTVSDAGRLLKLSTDGKTLTASSALAENAGGNVGIGTTSPNEKLEVSGNIKATQIQTTRAAWARVATNLCGGTACGSYHTLNVWTNIGALGAHTKATNDTSTYTIGSNGVITINKTGTYRIVVHMIKIPTAESSNTYACPIVNGTVSCNGLAGDQAPHSSQPAGRWVNTKHEHYLDLNAGDTLSYGYYPTQALDYWSHDGHTGMIVIRMN